MPIRASCRAVLYILTGANVADPNDWGEEAGCCCFETFPYRDKKSAFKMSPRSGSSVSNSFVREFWSGLQTYKDASPLDPHLVRNWACDQDDQIGQFIGLWTNFQSLWQQLIYPNLPHSWAIFVKVLKIYHFLVKSILDNFYRHLAIDFWSHCLSSKHKHKNSENKLFSQPCNN